MLLSTRQEVDEEGYTTEPHFSVFEKLRNKIIEYSKKSKDVYWIYYQMKLKRHSDEFPDEPFDIDYVEDVDRFWYYYSFEDKSDYLIARNGKIIRDLSR